MMPGNDDGQIGTPDVFLVAYRYDAFGRRCLKFDYTREDAIYPGQIPREIYYYDGDRVIDSVWEAFGVGGIAGYGDSTLDEPPPPPPPPPAPVPETEKRIAAGGRNHGIEGSRDHEARPIKLVSDDAADSVASGARTGRNDPYRDGLSLTSPSDVQGDGAAGAPDAAPKKQSRITYSETPEVVPDTAPPVDWHVAVMRQFVYGFDYIDEQVAQIMPETIDAGGNPIRPIRFVLQDANYNVVGIVSEGGQEFIRQYSYDPYGALIAAEDEDGDPLTPSDILESWHLFQGRWFDEDTGLIYYRGRWYNPTLGRFLTRDPNGLALALADNLAMNGQTKQAFASFDAWAQYADGPSPYQFLRSNPVSYTDPTGEFVPLLIVGGAIINAALKATTIYATGQDFELSRTDIAIRVGVAAAVGGMFGASLGGIGALTAKALGLGTVEQGVGAVLGILGTQGVLGGIRDKILAEDPIDNFLADLRIASGGMSILGAVHFRAFGLHRGPYSHLNDPPGVAAGKLFTDAQRTAIIRANKARNAGHVRSDRSGVRLVRPLQSRKGVRPAPNEWQIDHIIPRSKGGTNSYGNAQVLSRAENAAKSNE